MNHSVIRAALVFSVCAVAIVPCKAGGAEKDKNLPVRVVLPAGEIHEGWYFAAGSEVTIEGTVNGDAYVAGGRITIAGTINGDLLVAGGDIIVSGTVTDDIRAAGGQVHISGTTGKNISVAGGTITLERSAVVKGGLLAAGGSTTIAGTVEGEVRMTGGEGVVTGTVQRNLYFSGGDFVAYPGAVVGGALEAKVEDKDHVDLAEGVVRGPVEILTTQPRESPRILGFAAWHFWLKLLWAVSLLATTLFLAFAFPRQLVELGTTIASRPGASALWGVLTFILVPVLVLLLMMTLVGIPLALFALFLYCWFLYLAQLGLGVVLAHWLMGLDGKRGWSLFGAVVVGVVAVEVLTFVPYLRHLVTLLGIVFGLGALWLVFLKELQLNRARGGSPKPSPASAHG